MTEADGLVEDDLPHHHSMSIDDLLKDNECPGEAVLRQSAGLIGSPNNIWSPGYGSSGSEDFLTYNGSPNGVANNWSTFTSPFTGGSPVQGDPFPTPISQSESDAGSDHSWMFDAATTNGVEFGKVTTDQPFVTSQWGEGNGATKGVYSPFQGSSVIDDLDSGIHMSREKSPLRRSQSANSRPTFADVAKKPTSPGSEPPPTPGLGKDGPVYESHESLNSLHEKKTKPRVFRPAHPRRGGYHVPLPINPDSKYGLDDFEVQEAGKIERSFSCNDALDSSEVGGSSVDLDADSTPVANGGFPSSTGSAGKSWFDPKRIFHNGTTRTRSESVPCDTVLNNIASSANGTKSNGRRENTSYINNLHDVSNHRAAKQTNADRAKPAMNGNGIAASNGTSAAYASVRTVTSDTVTEDAQAVPSSYGDGALPNTTAQPAGYYLSGSVRLGKAIAMELFKYLVVALMFIIGVTGQIAYFVAHNTTLVVTTTFTYLAVKVGLNSGSPKEQDFNSFTKTDEQFTYGLDENIKLPDTSEEAMRRLLTCQGKDAYSILGIRSDASDEDIKRYYRRQAVLVHPDKNQQPGAEEAFKVLGQAVELIGTPEKRKVYDQKIREEKLSEDVMRQFSGLLTKFHEKMEEASNWMQCHHCGDKHRRYPTDKPVYDARKCDRCQCNHAAKEGEIWAETTFMGFKWHFYACMENKIYDVTPWISCQPDMVDKFKPNSHVVRLRMSLSNNGSSPPPRTTNPREAADLENLLKNLFPHQHSQPAAEKPNHGHGDGGSKSGGNSCNRKGKRRARRR